MSVCFFVPASDAAGASTSAEDPLEIENKQQEEAGESTEEKLAQFWTGIMDDIKKSNADHFKAQVLPLARIKKIMKLDEEVKMIASEAPVLFAKACEIFIHELTLRAWSHTCDNKRRTLQRNDIAMAISKSDQFDFLIDIVPRHEVKPPMKREEPPKPAPPAEAPRARPNANEDNNRYYLQLAQQQAAQAQPQQIVLQTQPYQMQQQSSATPATSSSSAQQPVTIVQQIVTPSGEVQPVPIQLTAAQLNMIRLQMQSNPSQPIIIQAAAPQPQIIQVTSQAQPQQQQVYVTQVSQESDS